MNAAAVLAVAPPFDLLPKRVRTTLIAASQERRFEAGELILDAFRTTPEQVGVLLAGAVELWVEGERAEAQSAPDEPDLRLGAGAVFGLDASLTGRAIGPRVVAAEASTVLLVPAADVERAMADGAGEAPDRSGRHALVLTPPHLRVDDLLTTRPLVLPAGLSVQQV
ncbi:MAG: hypothetical protein U0R67_13595, partial [Micropruina glycogenica]